jgi:thymidylate synthase
MEVNEQTIGMAHNAVMREILTDGVYQSIEVEPGKWMDTWEYPEPITTIIKRPLLPPFSSAALPYGLGFIEKYRQDILSITPQKPGGFSYTYPNRLFDYPIEDDAGMVGNGDGMGIDQIQLLVNKLVENPESRRALAITWVPSIDSKSIEPPCLQFVHILVRDNLSLYNEQFPGAIAKYEDCMQGPWCLSLRAAFRSHDMLLGAGPNWIALSGLQAYIATMLSRQVGQPIGIDQMVTFSSNAHIYVKAQSDEIKAFKRVLGLS